MGACTPATRSLIGRDKHEKASQGVHQGSWSKDATRRYSGRAVGQQRVNRDEMEQGRRQGNKRILSPSLGGSPSSTVGASMAGRPARRCGRNSQRQARLT